MNNDAPELSREARQIISAARGSDDPTQDDHDRVKARWLAGVAAVAGVSSLAEAARAAGGIGWGIKAVGAALAVAAGAIGLYVALPVDRGPVNAGAGNAGEVTRSAEAPSGRRQGTHERFEKTPLGSDRPVEVQHGAGKAVVVAEAPVPLPPHDVVLPEPAAEAQALLEAREAIAAPIEVPVVAAPVAVPVPERARTARRRERGVVAKPVVVEAPKAAEPAVAPPGAVSPAATPPAAAAPAGPSGQLGEELALLSQVRSSVQSGAPARALELLADYEKRFGKPILDMEADALRVDALCRSGQREAARASAQAFQNEWPGSPLERRVSTACP